MSAEMKLEVQSYTLPQFKEYVMAKVAPMMGHPWRPHGFALHNAIVLSKLWPGYDPKGNLWTPQQRIRNASVDWLARGMTKPPHIYFTQANAMVKQHMIHVLWPMWQAGEHSPGFNSWLWGAECFADFDREPLVDSFRDFVAEAMKFCYDMLGQPVNDDTFKLHYEDKKTTHHGCPGKNARPKVIWIDAMNAVGHAKAPAPVAATAVADIAAAAPAVIDNHHQPQMEFSPQMKAKLKNLEDFRDKAYLLKGVWHIGWGFRDGFRGLKIDANSTMTRAVADAMFEEAMDALADTIQSFVKAPLTQYQLDALGLITWNIGTSALEGSTIVKRLNASPADYAGAGEAFLMWNKWREKPTDPLTVSAELTTRRTFERSVFDGKTVLTAPPLVAVLASASSKPPAAIVVTRPAPAPGTAPLAPKPAAIAPAAPPVTSIPIEAGSAAAPAGKVVFVATAKNPSWLVPIIAKLNELVAKAA